MTPTLSFLQRTGLHSYQVNPVIPKEARPRQPWLVQREEMKAGPMSGGVWRPRRAASGLPISCLCCPVVAFSPYVAHSPTYAIRESHLPPSFQEFPSVCSGKLKNTRVAPNPPSTPHGVVPAQPSSSGLKSHSNPPPLSRPSCTHTLPGGLNSRLGSTYSAISFHDCSLRARVPVLPGSSSLRLNLAFPACSICLAPWFYPSQIHPAVGS